MQFYSHKTPRMGWRKRVEQRFVVVHLVQVQYARLVLVYFN